MACIRRGWSSGLPLPWLAAVLGIAVATPSWAVPSFARQTGMACAACHTVFPELTPFGREFKLNGYVLDNIKQIKGITLENRETLALNSLPPVSLMMQISYTHTGSALPDSAVSGALAKDGDVLFPQQASLFYAGKIADDLGAFVQLTYDGVGDSFGFDNSDIRYVRHYRFGSGKDGEQTRWSSALPSITVPPFRMYGIRLPPGVSPTREAASRLRRSIRLSWTMAPAASGKARPAWASMPG
ncbi:MAG: hypothetical protein M3N97_07335 [Pseudomonadota bacterium]|nr:hypothetical protein [Pseudomonadota bacterium]